MYVCVFVCVRVRACVCVCSVVADRRPWYEFENTLFWWDLYIDMLWFGRRWCMCFVGICTYLSNTTQMFLSRKAERPKCWWNCHGDWLYPRVFPVLPCPVVVWSQPVLDSAGWRVRHIDCWGNPDCIVYKPSPWALVVKRTDTLPQDLVKSRSRKIRVYTFPIARTFDKHLGSTAAEMHVNFRTMWWL